MINLSRVVQSSKFVQPFTVERKGGSYVEGRWTETLTSTINRVGIIQPAKQDQLNFLPEGERKDDTILIHCKDDILVGDGVSTMSDIIIYQGKKYRAAFMKPWALNGFYWVIAIGL